LVAFPDRFPKPNVDMASLQEDRRQNILDELRRMRRRRGRYSIEPGALRALERMTLDGWYAVRINLENYKTKNDDDSPADYDDTKQVRFYGRGEDILIKLMNLATVSHITKAVVKKAGPPRDPDAPDLRPLFQREHITLEDGSRFWGNGKRFEKRRKLGRKKASTGRTKHATARSTKDRARKSKGKSKRKR
jgi:hypothetical protein